MIASAEHLRRERPSTQEIGRRAHSEILTLTGRLKDMPEFQVGAANSVFKEAAEEGTSSKGVRFIRGEYSYFLRYASWQQPGGEEYHTLNITKYDPKRRDRKGKEVQVGKVSLSAQFTKIEDGTRIYSSTDTPYGIVAVKADGTRTASPTDPDVVDDVREILTDLYQ